MKFKHPSRIDHLPKVFVADEYTGGYHSIAGFNKLNTQSGIALDPKLLQSIQRNSQLSIITGSNQHHHLESLLSPTSNNNNLPPIQSKKDFFKSPPHSTS